MNLFSKILSSFLAISLGFQQLHGTDLPSDKFFTRSELSEDFDILYSSLIQYHPSPYMYTPEAELKAFYQTKRATLPDSLSELEFFKISQQLIAQLKCGHTFGRPSAGWFQEVKGKLIQLPFDVKAADGKVYIQNTTSQDLGFQTNDELISINGLPVKEILKEMHSIQERDGNTQSFAEEIVIRRFRTYYLFLYGFQDQFVIEYKSNDGDLKQVSVKPTNLPVPISKNPALPENMKISAENTWSRFAVDSANHIAYLQIKSFLNRNEFKDFYEQVFQQLRQMPGASLIVDLRDNTGGFFGHGNHFLSYFTPEKLSFNFQRPKGKIKKNDYASLAKWNKLTKFGFSVKPGGARVKGYKTTRFSYKPQKNPFQGKVSVLTNGLTFSMASLVAAQLKEYGSENWGTETGGAENSTNCMISYDITLPNTGIKVTIAHYQVLSNSTKGEFGYGVRPNFEVKPGLDSSKDEVLQQVLNSFSVKLAP
jgi:hypothetical protein